MKKKKSFGLYGTNKRKQPKRNNRYEMNYEDYEDYENDSDGIDDDDEYIVEYQGGYETEDYAEDTGSYYKNAEEYEDDGEYYESEEYADDDIEYETEGYADDIEEYETEEYACETKEYEAEGYADDVEEYGSEEYADADEYYESEEYIDDCEEYAAEEYADETEGYEAEEYIDAAEEYEPERYDSDVEDEYESEEYDFAEEYETDEYNGYDDEYYAADKHTYGGKVGRFLALLIERVRNAAANLTAFDIIVAATGIVVLVAGIVTFSIFHAGKQVEEQIAAISPIGDELINTGIVGDDGLIAMTGAALSGQFISGETVKEESSETEQGTEAADSGKVSVNFVSIEKDLKIRFTDSETGELITGTAFEVVLTSSKGKQLVLTDDDMDGIIYATNVTPGVFEAVITSTDKYKFPSTAQKVTVKDKVEYLVINIQDEVKKESQINVAAEDTQKQDAAKEEVKLTDTVEWVESTSTPIDGTESYILVDKDTIADPSKSAQLGKRMFFDAPNVTVEPSELSLFVNGTAQLKGSSFENSETETEKVEYSYKWESSESGIASVDGSGNVTAKAKGTAKITYTVTKTTTPIKPAETKQEKRVISKEEWEKLSDEDEKSKWTEETGENSETQYYQTVEVTTEKEYGSPVPETGSAVCKVTVSENGIKSGTLELKKSADSCAVGATLTVSPSKLVYTKDDGSTQTLTEGFPSVSWSSADKTVATIDDKGVVTGVKTGSTTVKGIVTVKNSAGNDISIEAAVTVTITDAPVFSLVLDRTDGVYLAVGGETTLVATVSNAKSDSGVTWTTSDKKIATVDENGKVTGVAAGSVTITATTKEKNTDGKQLTATCKVTINSDAMNDTTTKLKDKNGNQIYIKDSEGNYKEAVYADYFTAKEFYMKTDGNFAYTGWQTINGRTYYYDKNGNPVTGTQIIQGVTYNFGSDGAIATTVNGSTFGIDISRHNGNIDWNAVKASGVDYVILRCGYRGSATGVLIEDESFKKNIKGATAAGLKVGVYVFSQAIDEVEAVKEASLAVSLVKGYKLTYPIFIDTESSGGRADKIDKATRTAVVNAFCQTVASAGYQAGIYASKTWYEDKLNMSAVGNYKIWLAQYAAKPTYNSKYDMWQYSSKGTISGIKGNVDLNWSYMGY